MKIFFLILLLTAVGGLYLYQNFIALTRDSEKKNQTQVLQIGENAIYVSDQKPGQFVIVDFASLAKKGFIVIHESNQGNLGQIIGNSLIIQPGESKNIFVGLVRPVIHGESFFAMIYEDSGDGIFTPDLDLPLKDENENIIYMKFNINRDAERPQDVNI